MGAKAGDHEAPRGKAAFWGRLPAKAGAEERRRGKAASGAKQKETARASRWTFLDIRAYLARRLGYDT